MKKSIQVCFLFLLFVSSSIKGQNGFVMAVAGDNPPNRSAISFVKAAMEVTSEWEVTRDVVNNNKKVTYSMSNPYLHNTIELVPSYSRQLLKLKTSAKNLPRPIHAVDRQFSQVKSVVPKLQAPIITIDKRPKSFGPLYSF